MRIFLLLVALVLFCGNLPGQKRKVDSLHARLAAEKIDSNRVTLMWLMADAANMYDPDTSLQLAQKALFLAQQIRFIEGESRSLGVLAVAFRQIGDYQKALQYFFQKLQLEEKRESPRNLASVLINIGILYVYLEQYNEAVLYYKRADSVINQFNVNDLEYYINNNLGDVYERLNQDDSAFARFTKAVQIAGKINDDDLKGTSITGLGHIYLKQKKINEASQAYRQALVYLEASNDDDLVCEASLGMARLYEGLAMKDSARYYAMQSFRLARTARFESRELDAAQFLANHYKNSGVIDSAFAYFQEAQALKDSIHSKDKIRALQVISSNEHLRQNEIAENKRKAAEERRQQMQLLVIGIFIPVLFLLTLFLNRIKVNRGFIKFLGVLSLLMFFEYLLLLLHPRVVEFTHHTPVYEILIFVAIASVLVPAHHRIEHWLINRLTKGHGHANGKHGHEDAHNVAEQPVPAATYPPGYNDEQKTGVL
ncbi:tetratricopeptide repeat protein [Foetidibacter luteolus]|uniref:tetratricopeptide repeat protein n=1 Tax=Foetidibacter luteolus TaxID=2608880 RepID=UPI00129B79B3|nr:tetratricopeptide repeat protein [Foetidibacter luteolus]